MPIPLELFPEPASLTQRIGRTFVMIIGVMLSAICAGLLAGAPVFALDYGVALAALAYMLGGGLGVSVFVALVEVQRR